MTLEENWCGTKVYCGLFDTSIRMKRRGPFKTGQECLDAHEPEPSPTNKDEAAPSDSPRVADA